MTNEGLPSSAKPPEDTRPPTLSANEAKALDELKALCKKNGLYWPVSQLEDHPACGSNDDVDFLRFLSARSYDVEAAYKQYSASAAWRRKCKLNETYDNADIQAFERMNRVQPQWTGRRDKKGIPVMVYVLSAVRPSDLSQIAKEDPDLTSIFLPAEYITRFTQRLCTHLPHPAPGPINKSTNIIDLSSVGLRKFWNLRNLLQTASSMATAHYPETVERIFVLGAPYFFPTIWSLVTRWFDAATTRKIHVLSAGQATETLKQFIAPENFPKRFGGELEWEMGMHPILDEEARAVVGNLGEGPWVEGPIRWIPGKERDVLMAAGSEGGKARREILAEIPKREKTPQVITNGMV